MSTRVGQEFVSWWPNVNQLPGCEERAYSVYNLIGSVSFETPGGNGFFSGKLRKFPRSSDRCLTGPLTRSMMSGWHYWLSQMRKGTHVFNS